MPRLFARKKYNTPCQVTHESGIKITGSCVNFNEHNSGVTSQDCSCYYVLTSNPTNISCIGGESYCYSGTEYICNADNKSVTEVKTCGVAGCDESTDRCKVVPTSTPKQLTCYFRYRTNSECTKSIIEASYPTQTCEQISRAYYSSKAECEGKYKATPTFFPTSSPNPKDAIYCYDAINSCNGGIRYKYDGKNTCEALSEWTFTSWSACDLKRNGGGITTTPVPSSTVRVPTSTPILFVTTPVPTSAPIIFVTNTPAPKVTLPVPTPTIVINEPVNGVPVCQTTSGLLSRFSWWRKICAK